MAVDLYSIGLSHHATPISMRERLSLPASMVRDSLRDLCAGRSVQEAAILSTCNRTEVYCTGKDPEPVRQWLSRLDSLNRPEETVGYIRIESNEAAAFHAFKVASGLDSMVIGEPQITGQFKLAFVEARSAGTLGTVLGRLCDQSLSVAKKIRTETALGQASVSLPSLTTKVAKRIFPQPEENTVLFIGSGEMIEIGMERFSRLPVRSVSLSNRTVGKVNSLAKRFGATRIPFEQIPDALHEFDIVYSSTSSSIPIIGKGALERALKRRKRRPMLLIDLAVPRDIEPEAERLDDVFLYTVDDLGRMAANAGLLRESALGEANTIAGIHSRRFLEWMRTRPRSSAISDIRSLAARIRDAEISKAMRQIKAGKPPDEVLKAMSYRLTSKLLHAPTRLIGSDRLGEEEEALLRDLYDATAMEQDVNT